MRLVFFRPLVVDPPKTLCRIRQNRGDGYNIAFLQVGRRWLAHTHRRSSNTNRPFIDEPWAMPYARRLSVRAMDFPCFSPRVCCPIWQCHIKQSAFDALDAIIIAFLSRALDELQCCCPPTATITAVAAFFMMSGLRPCRALVFRRNEEVEIS